MSRNLSVAVENSFSKGLITEATALNFPENACTDTLDCVFNRTGEVTRRLGIELEDEFEAFENDFTGKAVTEYLWESVGQDGDITIFVLQIGSTVSFFGLSTEGSLSPSIKSFSIDLDGYIAPGATAADIDQNHAQFASGYGMLWIVHPYCNPIEIEYNSETDEISQRMLELEIRDVDGVGNADANTGVPIPFNFRPNDTHMSQAILYNLYNQGWNLKTVVTTTGKHWFFSDHPLEIWRGTIQGDLNPMNLGRGDWPAEGDIWYSMKGNIVPNLQDDGNIIPPVPPGEGFSFLAIDKVGQPMAPAPKGHYILKAFAEDRRVAVLAGEQPFHIDSQNSTSFPTLALSYYDRNAGKNRPSTSAFHAGRVFYSGVAHEKYTGDIFFSQILERNRNADRCYQHNDPTHEGTPDLLANDGGIVRIPMMARCVKLMSVGSNLIAFATNGVWRIGGSLGESAGGFAANDYTVNKISDIGCISPLSFVRTDKGIMWWNHDGLWALAQDPTAGIQVVNLAESTIQTYLDDLPSTEFRWVKGSFNPVSKIVQWLHRTTISDAVEERYEYDRILNLNTQTGAFYPWTIPDTCLKVVGIQCIKGVGEEFSDENVVDNADANVTDITGENVTVEISTPTDLSSRFKYVVRNDCEALEIPEEPEEETGLDENLDFFGHAQFSVSTHDTLRTPTNSGILKGGDGNFYVVVPSNTSDQFSAIRYTTSGASVQTYSLANQIADINAAMGTGYPSTHISRNQTMVIPVPMTKYFYFASARVVSATVGQGWLMLYQINNSGNIEFTGFGIEYSGTSRQMNTSSNQIYVCGVGYGASNEDEPVDRPLYVALNGSSFPVFSTFESAVMKIPSVTEFQTISGDTITWDSLFVTGLGEGDDFFTGHGSWADQNHGKNLVFFLDGASDTTLCCMYVDNGTAEWHNDNPAHGTTDPTILSFSATNPDGFIIAQRITDQTASGTWQIWNSHFVGGTGFPVNDLGEERDGSAGDEYNNDWQSPTVQPRDSSDGTSYVIWPRRYDTTDLNYDPTGNFIGAQMFIWDSGAEIGTFVDDIHMSMWTDIVDDGIEDTESAKPYPVTLIPFLDPDDFDELFMFLFTDEDTDDVLGAGMEYVMSKLADFETPTVTATPISLSFAEYNNTDYTDWEQSLGGEDYTSHFTTGYKLRGEGNRKWQDNYLSIFSKPDDIHETSVLDIHAKWDYANTGDTGRWSTTQRITQDDTEYDYGMRRIKVRGHGKAMQFKVTSVEREPFNLIGWSSWDSANAKP